MSQPREPMPAKLVIRFLFSDPAVQAEVLRRLESLFGPMDYLSAPGPFSYTDYYEREMGQDLRRQTAAYSELIAPVGLADAKLRTNELEKEFPGADGRKVNIDPGILSEERFVLATGKNFTHRIYLREGIYADLTLMYQKGAYRPLPWTYPDYREPEFIHVLGVLRKKLRFQCDGVLPVV